jgi:polyisoprenoid-binding protein YceI
VSLIDIVQEEFMKLKNMLVAASVVSALASAGFAADKYNIDPNHSTVGFSVKHMVVTNVKGRFKDYSGTLMYDEKDPTKSSVDVDIKTASITTDNDQRDNHLKSPDFFDAAKFPDITFKSSKVEKKGENYLMTGTLTMKGVSKEVQIPVTINGSVKDPWGSTRLGTEGSLKINRQDYGINWSKTMDNGGLVAGNDVNIDLQIEFVKAQDKK